MTRFRFLDEDFLGTLVESSNTSYLVVVAAYLKSTTGGMPVGCKCYLTRFYWFAEDL